MTYTVEHYWTNPRNNTALVFDDINDAIDELVRYSSDDDNKQCSHLYTDHELVAEFDWFSQELKSYDESVITSRVID